MSNLVQHLAPLEGVKKIYYYGFQNVHGDKSLNKRILPRNVEVYDAMANEEPKKMGFGEENIKDYVLEKNPDIVLISNDSIVVEKLTSKFMEIPERKFKIVVYQDLVYEHMKKRFVDQLNAIVDRVLAFTPYWKEHMQEQGVTTPIDVIRHGFDPMTKYPVDTKLARLYYGLKENDFLILNLNRNQPRKRWDICLKAFADFVGRHRGEPIKLLIGTSIQGSWDLMAIYERELKKRGITLEEGKKHLVVTDAPQKRSDEEINILMNCADIGISASDGEGFGLCNFEHAAMGYPQVVSNTGGHKDFFTEDRAILCDPMMAYYVDSSRDGVGGEAQLIDYRDMVEGMELYYSNPSLRKKHGEASRDYIVKNYKWKEQAEALYESFKEAIKETVVDPTNTDVPDEIDLIPDVGQIADKLDASESKDDQNNKADENVNVEDIQKEAAAAAPTSAPPHVPGDAPDLQKILSQLATLTAEVQKMTSATT